MPELYDRIHSVMIDWLLMHFKKYRLTIKYSSNEYQIYPEFIYNHYGNRGSVDILVVSEGFPEGKQIEIYEVWSRVDRLEEAIRKFNEKSEFVPQYYLQKYPAIKIKSQSNHFVMLSSRENAQLVTEHSHTFEAQCPVLSSHIGDEKVGWDINNRLVFIDPLEPDLPDDIFEPGPNEITLHNIPFHVINSWRTKMEVPLKEWVYQDTRDFWSKYSQQNKLAKS